MSTSHLNHTQQNTADAYELLLFDYATGNLDMPQSLIVMSHTMLNEGALNKVNAYETTGGMLLETQDQADINPDSLDNIFAKIEATPADAKKVSDAAHISCSVLPEPIAQMTRKPVTDIQWKSVLPGIQKTDLPFSRNESFTELLKIDADKAVPSHSHGGQEITLVLDGSFFEGDTEYKRGDLVVADGSVTHAPLAGSKGCVCITSRTAPLRFKGLFGNIINPFLKH